MTATGGKSSAATSSGVPADSPPSFLPSFLFPAFLPSPCLVCVSVLLFSNTKTRTRRRTRRRNENDEENKQRRRGRQLSFSLFCTFHFRISLSHLFAFSLFRSSLFHVSRFKLSKFDTPTFSQRVLLKNKSREWWHGGNSACPEPAMCQRPPPRTAEVGTNKAPAQVVAEPPRPLREERMETNRRPQPRVVPAGGPSDPNCTSPRAALRTPRRPLRARTSGSSARTRSALLLRRAAAPVAPLRPKSFVAVPRQSEVKEVELKNATLHLVASTPRHRLETKL